jgi:hypothetical protein
MFWKYSLSTLLKKSVLLVLVSCIASNQVVYARTTNISAPFVQGEGPLQVPQGPDAAAYAAQQTRTYFSPQRGNEKTSFECKNAVFPGSNCVHPPYHIIQYPHELRNAEHACKLVGKRLANVTHTSIYALLNQLLLVNCSDSGAAANQICGLKHDNGTALVVYANGSWGFKEAQPNIRYMVICE